MTSDANGKELALTLEVADILDELNMLGNLFAKQRDIWISLNKTLSEWRPRQNQKAGPPESFEVNIHQEWKGKANISVGSQISGHLTVTQPQRGVVNLTMDQNKGLVDAQMLGITGTGGASFEDSWLELRRAIESVERLKLEAEDTHKLVRGSRSKFLLTARVNMRLAAKPAQSRANQSKSG